MTRQQDVFSMQEESAAVHCPDPVSLETIELIHDSLAQLLRSLRRSVPSRAAEAGRLEYDSWLPRSH
ncbi:MAG: hypothetical protein ABI409_18205 [Ramlibacter sp.]